MSVNEKRSGYARLKDRGYDLGNYWDAQMRINKQKLADALRRAGKKEHVNTDHGSELPTRINPGQVGQVTSYNPLPARGR